MNLKSLLPDFTQLAEAGIAILVISALFYSMWKVFDHHRKEREQRVKEHREERNTLLKDHKEERVEWRKWAETNEKRTHKLLGELTEAIRDMKHDSK